MNSSVRGAEPTIARRAAALLPLAALAMLLCTAGWSAAGQQPLTVESSSPARFAMSPQIAVTDLGFDTNILTTDYGQQRDVGAKLAAQVTPRLDAGPLTAAGKASVRWGYFRDHAYERSVDTDNNLAIDLRTGRLTTHVAGLFVRSRDPFDPQVYARTLRTETGFEAGAAWRVTGKTSADVTAHRSTVAFDFDQVLLSGLTHDAFTRDVDDVSVSVRDQITVLTAITATGGARRERVAGGISGTSDSVHALAGFEFQPGALFDGRIAAGYRQFDAAGGIRRNGDAIGSVDLGMVIADWIRVAVQADRDVRRSFSRFEPYVRSMQFGGSLTKAVNRAWAVKASVSRVRLVYEQALLPFEPDAVLGLERGTLLLDHMRRYGLETTCHVGTGTDFAVSADYYQFESHLAGVPYDRIRAVAAVTHRF